MTSKLTVRRALWLGILLAGPIAACGSKAKGLADGLDGTNPGGGSSDDGGGGGAGSSGGSSSGGGGSSVTGGFSEAADGGAGSVLLTADAACAFSTQMGEQQALNAYMMLDYSLSMQMQRQVDGHHDRHQLLRAAADERHLGGSPVFRAADPDGGPVAGLFGLIPAVRRLVRSGRVRAAGHRDCSAARGRQSDHVVARGAHDAQHRDADAARAARRHRSRDDVGQGAPGRRDHRHPGDRRRSERVRLGDLDGEPALAGRGDRGRRASRRRRRSSRSSSASAPRPRTSTASRRRAARAARSSSTRART